MPAARPIKKKIKKKAGSVLSHSSRSQPDQAPITTASTKENPTVLKIPTVKNVLAKDLFSFCNVEMVSLSIS